MLTGAGPKVLEFNCRLGDPETQAIVRAWTSTWRRCLAEVAAGILEPARLKWKSGQAFVLCSLQVAIPVNSCPERRSPG